MESTKHNIVWIVSYPKSGNTWFRLFLSSIINPEKESIDINNFDSTFISSDRSVFDRISGTNSSDLTVDEINIIKPQVYRIISLESPKTVFIKVHEAWHKNTLNAELFPREITKKVILIVRNPLDLTISLSNHNGISIKRAIDQINNTNFCLAGSQNRMPTQLCQYLSNWSEHFRSWVDHSGLDVHVIRYEDMLSKPIQAFSDAIKFLDFEVNLDNIKSSIEKCSFEVLQDQEKKFGFKEKPVRSDFFFKTGKQGYWKDFLNKDAIRKIENNHSEIMNRLNYYQDI